MILTNAISYYLGIIQAISGTQPGLNVITEMVCGQVNYIAKTGVLVET
jgi:hypothetical protein